MKMYFAPLEGITTSVYRNVHSEIFGGCDAYFTPFITPSDNEKIGRKFTVSYSGDTLTDFLLWKNMTSGDYALGLEPCTTKLDDLFGYSTIQAGETIAFSLNFTITE